MGKTLTQPAKQKPETQPVVIRKRKQSGLHEIETSSAERSSKKAPQFEQKSEKASGGVRVKRQRGDHHAQQILNLAASPGSPEAKSAKKSADAEAQQQVPEEVRVQSSQESVTICTSLFR